KPLQEYIEKNGEAIDKSSGSRIFKFQHFTLTMVFAYLMQVPSLRKLTNKLELSDRAKYSGLNAFAWTTIRDGFTRFSADFFIKMYRHVLQHTKIVRLNSIDELDLISLVDGSIFPTISNMCWAQYKKTQRAIRLHIEFSLNQMVYRLVIFTVLQSEFRICTNRLDLSTLEIIMLYGYRWQIELLFKFIKRELHRIDLFNHSQNGANIQFCLLMIMSVLYLNLGQFCKINGSCTKANVKNQEISSLEQPSSITDFNTYLGYEPNIWINSINKAFESLWKISSYWIENLKELIDKPFEYQLINVLARD
ncbi:MAG: transposase, partial [Bacteroidota bacterium]